MNQKPEDIRKEILSKVIDFYQATLESKAEFRPGRDIIPFGGRIYDEKELCALVDSSLDFWLTSGPYADRFSSDFAEFMETKFCSLVNSGSSANLIAVSALTSESLKERRLKPGDEVITVAAGFPTTVNPIFQNNLTPVFVDVEMGTYNINPELLEQALSDRTKAIIVAHTLGNPFDLDRVSRFARENNLYLIEDCCDAVGSLYNGKKTGSFGDFSTASFYPAHHITMGEGGAVLTSDPDLFRTAVSFRDWGRDCHCGPGKDNSCGNRFNQQFGTLPFGYDHKYVYSNIGYNLKVTDMQAAIGCEQLAKLPDFIQKRKENFRKLHAGLKKFEDRLILPEKAEKADPSWFAFPISVRSETGITRTSIVSHLEDAKIMTRQLFAGNLTRQPAYENSNYRIAGSLDNTDRIMNDTFFIGVYPGIDGIRIDHILSSFEQFFKNQ